MPKFGVFIDADNVSPEMASRALESLLSQGQVLFIRAYGNWSSKPSVWKEFVNKYGINTVHRYNITRTKNAADISMAVDAAASLFESSAFDCLAVVSSDADFMPLIQLAHSRGKSTIGLGLQKAPTTYTNHCNKFVFLDDPRFAEVA